MACRIREELVGKRFISVKSEGKHKVGKISDWEWRPGFVRAVSTRDTSNADFTVLVEFDDTGWKSREYVKVHHVFLEFLVEHTLTWVERKQSSCTVRGPWPALCFRPVVDRVGLFRQTKRPVEFLNDRCLSIVDEQDITYYREGDENSVPTVKECPELIKWVKAWTDYQDGQKILLTTPTVLLGYRVEVYRTEGTTQWYTAVIKSYNHANKSLTLTDDTVLEEHNEDPALIQMHLIGDGVVDSILNGVDVGVAQRRRPRSTVTRQNSKSLSSIISIGRGTANYYSSSNNNNCTPNQAKSSAASGGAVPSNGSTPAAPTAANANNKSGSTKTKGVAAVEETAPTSSVATFETSGVKGHPQLKNQKQTPKRKSDPPARATKKPISGKKIKKSASEENLDASSPVCRQTCNVVVKRIEESTQSAPAQFKPKPPKLRNNGGQNKKPPDLLKDDRLSESSLKPVNRLTIQKEPVPDLRDGVSGENQDSFLSETKKRRETEKGGQDGENAFTRPVDKEQALNPTRASVLSGNAEIDDKKSACDNSIGDTSALASILRDNVLISTSRPDSAGPGQDDENSSKKSNRNDSDNENVNVQVSAVLSESTNESSESCPIGTTPKEKETSSASPNTRGHSPGPTSDEDMHYKKQILRTGGKASPSQNCPQSSVSEEIDLNRSLTDQLANRNNLDKLTQIAEAKPKLETVDSVPPSISMFAQRRTEQEGNSLFKPHDFCGDRQSAFTCVQSSTPRSNPTTPAAVDRSDSRSDAQLPPHVLEDKMMGSRASDSHSMKIGPGTSPLVIDRHEAVNPYRDPELMRKNPVQSNVQNMLAAQQKLSKPAFPSVHVPIPGAPAPPHFTGVQAHQARGLLGALPYANAHQLASSLTHPLALSHGYPMDAVVRAQQLAALQQQHVIGYTLSSAPALATLEALWQRKFPTTPLPAHYMLQKSQEALLPADIASVLHMEHLQFHMEQERRELERIEVERRERERDRLEQELRGKERQEILERERQEKEKEREKAERDRIERERLEKERIEREWEQKKSQEHILDTEAAVDKHFAESLTRLACQQGINMFPSITQGTGRGLIPKTEAHHGLPPHGLSYDKKHFEPRTEDQVKREVDSLPDDKWYTNKQDCEKPSVFNNYPYGAGGYHPSAGIPQAGQTSFFNLYGYPSSHSTITPEQLKQRVLGHEPRQIKEEVADKKYPFSSIPPHASSPITQAYTSKDIKQEAHNSVIVKRDSNPLKMENPVAAHSYHSSSSSSSPRPQHPRPAHTPEHWPDRPIPSSTSPASSIHPHLSHHSSPAPPVSSHQMSSHNTAFCGAEARASPRSQSPYKPAASQPQPLNFCKSSAVDMPKAVEHQQSLSAHTGYPSSAAPASTSLSNSAAYSYNLIQQGLVPNPIYSHIGLSHPAAPAQHNQGPHAVGGLSPETMPESKPAQLSPSGNKRKTGSRDNNAYSRKKTKGHSEISDSSQVVTIPQTTPQLITDSSLHTTATTGFVSLNKPGINSVTPSHSPSSVSAGQVKTCFMDSFKSFVENTVQNAFLQDEKKAKEKAERERALSSMSLPPCGKSESDLQERKPIFQPQPLPGGPQLIPSATPSQDVPQPSTSDSYSCRIMDTINRVVANNQVDTDSDTLSASSPPPQIKPSDTNSPVGRNGNSSCANHPHHMKKAWLQRHDEDKKSETPVPILDEEDSDSNFSHTKDVISCFENSSAAVDDCQESGRSSPADVVVTLPNGNLSDFSHRHDDSTSSESENQNLSKVSGSNKRANSSKSVSGSSKKAKSERDKEATTTCLPSSDSSSQKKVSNKHGKVDKESTSKDDSHHAMKQADHPSLDLFTAQEKGSKMSPSSPQERSSNPSPALSESNAANMSPASYCSSNSSINNTAFRARSNSKENKDKKKLMRQSKEISKDSKKSSFNKPLVKTSVSILKKTMIPFVQDCPCSEITPKLNKCRECKMTPVQRSKKQPNIFCRFYAFRRLKYNSRGIVTIHGFSELSDADPDDIEPWLPRFPVEEPELDVENSKFIIAKVGDKFCELVEQEKEAKSWAGKDVNIVWKRAVVGVREMCDVCDTTLFNIHWVCQKCGFVVCLDCYQVRIKESKKSPTEDKWLTCSSNRQTHKASEMMLTQIIPSDALWELGRLIHDIRVKWSIPSNCPCGGNNVENRLISKNGINQQLKNSVSSCKFPNGYNVDDHGSKHQKAKKHQDSNPLQNLDAYNPDTASSPLSILAEVASMEPDSNREKSDGKRKAEDELLEETEKKSGCSTLRELLTKTAGKPKGTNDKKAKKTSGLSSLDNIIQSVVEKSCSDGGTPFKFLHYTPRLGGWKRELPIMVHNLTETSVLYPDVPHSWLCDGRLLRLHDAHHKGNLQIFQEQWKRGQPVLVSCANKKMNINIWKPEAFSKEFYNVENEVVNCRTGDIIIGHTLGDFWDGFESLSNRPIDAFGDPMLLKLKDWPPGDDFSELLPSRFQDLMNALPLPEYTQRAGKLNLASRLPDFLVRPDLGPKMYNAYGSSHFPKEGTTNLHLDISDAVNVMVYVGVPGDGPGGRKAEEAAAVKAIDDAGCDSITKRRVREVHEIPGALWHIYDAHDADKIRDFLNKVAKERGESIEKDHDAIHDQSWYLDKELCDRLLKEYGVQSYPIVQCLGDAIFIPAGAPHQVRNLHSCVKVAEDFVSPEHLNHCFRLTQEFRQLSDTHSNHEDKLQVKNIIYHAVKDAIAVLREHDPEDE